ARIAVCTVRSRNDHERRRASTGEIDEAGENLRPDAAAADDHERAMLGSFDDRLGVEAGEGRKSRKGRKRNKRNQHCRPECVQPPHENSFSCSRCSSPLPLLQPVPPVLPSRPYSSSGAPPPDLATSSCFTRSTLNFDALAIILSSASSKSNDVAFENRV